MISFSPPGWVWIQRPLQEDRKSIAAVFGVYRYCQKLKTQQDKFDGWFLMSPLSFSRSGVLRQGFDKFYSVSFQARLRFLVCFLKFLTRLKANLVTNFSFPPWLSLPPPLVEVVGEHQKISILLVTRCIADSYLLLYKNVSALFSSIFLWKKLRFSN